MKLVVLCKHNCYLDETRISIETLKKILECLEIIDGQMQLRKAKGKLLYKKFKNF